MLLGMSNPYEIHIGINLSKCFKYIKGIIAKLTPTERRGDNLVLLYLQFPPFTCTNAIKSDTKMPKYFTPQLLYFISCISHNLHAQSLKTISPTNFYDTPIDKSISDAELDRISNFIYLSKTL